MRSVRVLRLVAPSAHAGDMSSSLRGGSPARDAAPRTAHGRPSPNHHWGYLDTTYGRYGSITTHLVVYPPGSRAVERRVANAVRMATPILLVVAVSAWTVMLGVGLDPWMSFVVVVAVSVGAAMVSARITSRVRRASAAAWTWRSALSPVEGDALLEARLIEIAGLLEASAERLDACQIGRDQHMRAWCEAFDEVSASSTSPGRATY